MKNAKSGILALWLIGTVALMFGATLSRVYAQSSLLDQPTTTAPSDSTNQANSPDQNLTGTIRQIVLNGNVNIREEAIRGVLRQKIGDPYNANSLEADRQAIQDMGYFSAVTEHVDQGDTPGSIVITYVMVENPKVLKIVFVGNKIEPSDKLQKVMRTQVNQVLNTTTLSQDIQAIVNVYQEAGYRASISEDINVDPATGVLTIPIIEAIVSSIQITGNRVTKPFVITREFKTKVGQPYNEIQFRKDLTKVYNLQLFESVGPADISTPDVGKVALSIPVKEKQTGQIQVGVGYSTQEKLVGRAGLSQTNFRGLGETASIQWEVSGAQSQSSFELGFGDPFIDKHHTGVDVSLYNKAVYRFSSSFVGGNSTGDSNQYYERHKGGSLTLSRPINDTTTGFITGRGESVRSNNVSIPTADSYIRQDADVYGLGFRLVSNTRDNEFNPAAGGYFAISFEEVEATNNTVGNAPTPLAPGRHTFPKIGLDLRKYISLQGPRRHAITEAKKTLAFRLLAGFTNADIPFSEQYFLGGADSLRGYQDDRFWGNNLLLLNSEFRFPVASSLTGVLFTDVGDAWGSIYQGTDLSQHKNATANAAVGVGIRVTTPIGPIRIDYGVGRDGGRTDFSIGQSF